MPTAWGSTAPQPLRTWEETPVYCYNLCNSSCHPNQPPASLSTHSETIPLLPPPLWLQGFRQAGALQRTMDSVRWGADYLVKTHRALPDTNSSLLVTRVG